MITLTSRAAERVLQLQNELADASRKLRIFVEKGGCSGMEYGMSFDERKPDDQEVESEGVRFLVDPASLSHLKGCKVDFDDGLSGKGFEVINPNAKTTCGCGRSFN